MSEPMRRNTNNTGFLPDLSEVDLSKLKQNGHYMGIVSSITQLVNTLQDSKKNIMKVPPAIFVMHPTVVYKTLYDLEKQKITTMLCNSCLPNTQLPWLIWFNIFEIFQHISKDYIYYVVEYDEKTGIPFSSSKYNIIIKGNTHRTRPCGEVVPICSNFSISHQSMLCRNCCQDQDNTLLHLTTCRVCKPEYFTPEAHTNTCKESHAREVRMKSTYTNRHLVESFECHECNKYKTHLRLCKSCCHEIAASINSTERGGYDTMFELR